jgi:catechol 2,3-dioxygenase-like lactoylglutathione lyase family enzyme
MKSADPAQPPNDKQTFQIVGLNYVSLYIEDFAAAIDFYERVFGPAENADEAGQIYGWWMGSTWLTVFPSRGGTHEGSNPRNVEFAIQVSTSGEVDALHQALITAGA